MKNSNSREWATEQAEKGLKVTHTTFKDFEYVRMAGTRFFSQNDTLVTYLITKFDVFSDGWSLFEEPKVYEKEVGEAIGESVALLLQICKGEPMDGDETERLAQQFLVELNEAMGNK